MRQRLNGDRLRDAIARADLSFIRVGMSLYLQEYTRRVVPAHVVAAWVAGKVNPHERTVVGLAAVLGVTAEYLYGGEGVVGHDPA